jgi:hypothetical protein
MTEEIKNEVLEEKKECKCRKELKMFLLTILGSFLGCLVALTLFTAAIKPQPPMPQQLPPQRIEAIRMDVGAPRGEFRGDRGPDFRQEKFRHHEGAQNQKPPVDQQKPPVGQHK